jgi:hypothetical protein
MHKISRRTALASIGAAAFSGIVQARPKGPLVENTLHMFAEDQTRFPYHPNATYKPRQIPRKISCFVKEAQLDHTVLVRPEPYQDDEHIEYCFTRAVAGLLFSTCLYDPIDQLPGRIELVKRNPGRIVGMRIHEVHQRGTPSTTRRQGPRPEDPAMKPVFRKIESWPHHSGAVDSCSRGRLLNWIRDSPMRRC